MPVKLIIAGAGGRGQAYGQYALGNPDLAQVVGVAEPRDYYRELMVSDHGIASEHVFTDWKDLAACEKFADAVLICTQDHMHADPAVAFADKGYHILLEKPMAPNEADCRRIVAAAIKAGTIFTVCHVLRYTRYTEMLRAVVESGAIGDIVSMQHLEPVGYWHQAHSFVRGNWRNEAESSPMLLAKSCHDVDWIRYIMNCKCMAVSSFGSLKHFRKDERPAGAADRCLDCGVESTCPYSAKKVYLSRVYDGNVGWPANMVTPDLSVEGVTEALRSGPYGRCVYACDNDVVDNQVVNMLFEGDRTVSFTMTAFTEGAHRQTKIFGTRGMISGDGQKIRTFDFMTDEWQEVDTEASDGSIAGGHGGGDEGLMTSFVAAVAKNDPSMVRSGPEETLESHLMVFAAERARKEKIVVEIA